MIRQAIAEAADRRNLPSRLMEAAVTEMTEGGATDAQIGAFLVAMRFKGETVDEIASAARVLRRSCSHVPTLREARGGSCLVDTCGTGGDSKGTFNFSTVAALVAAGAGAYVAKHGNRGVSSACGSADLMQALGLPLDMSPEETGASIDKVGIGFLYAPALHSSMRHVTGPRREIGLRTLFNVLGPLCNPAGADAQLIGVYDAGLAGTLAGVLHELGCRRAWVVHGDGGYDEITITGPTTVVELLDGSIGTFRLEPGDFGLCGAGPVDILGGNPRENAGTALSILGGEDSPRAGMVLMNAAAALVIAGTAGSLLEGMRLARESVLGGAAMDRLESMVSFASTARAGRARPGSHAEPVSS